MYVTGSEPEVVTKSELWKKIEELTQFLAATVAKLDEGIKNRPTPPKDGGRRNPYHDIPDDQLENCSENPLRKESDEVKATVINLGGALLKLKAIDRQERTAMSALEEAIEKLLGASKFVDGSSVIPPGEKTT
jgi:hypothetical protein